MLAEATELGGYIAIAVGTLIAGLLGGQRLERRLNGRRNASNNQKPGLGKVCREHDEQLGQQRETVAALGAH